MSGQYDQSCSSERSEDEHWSYWPEDWYSQKTFSKTWFLRHAGLPRLVWCYWPQTNNSGFYAPWRSVVKNLLTTCWKLVDNLLTQKWLTCARCFLPLCRFVCFDASVWVLGTKQNVWLVDSQLFDCCCCVSVQKKPGLLYGMAFHRGQYQTPSRPMVRRTRILAFLVQPCIAKTLYGLANSQWAASAENQETSSWAAGHGQLVHTESMPIFEAEPNGVGNLSLLRPQFR